MRATPRRTRRRWARQPAPALTYELPVGLGRAQFAVFTSPARFRVLFAGRRFGKTVLACIDLVESAVNTPGSLNWYVAPTYAMAKDIAWEMLKALVPAEYVKGKPNESSLTIRLINGSVIALKGAEHPNRLRGRSLTRCVLDEFPMMKPAVWTEAIRPSLADQEGRALFIGTPLGFNWGYDLYLQGLQYDGTGAREWASWQFTTIQGGRVSQKEIAAARALLDPRVFRQEFEASFEALAGRVYSNFDRAHHVSALAEDDGVSPVLVGLDFNVNPMSAVLAQQAQGVAGPECHVFDAIELQSSNTEEMAAALRARFPREVPDPRYPAGSGRTVPGRPVVICPDPSGKARKTSAPVGQTDFTILTRHGFTIDAPHQAPLVKDGVNNVQALLLAADGHRRFLVHPRAAPLIKALDGLTYKPGTNTPDKDAGLDHLPDALRYLCWQRFNRLKAAGWATSHFAL